MKTFACFALPGDKPCNCRPAAKIIWARATATLRLSRESLPTFLNIHAPSICIVPSAVLLKELYNTLTDKMDQCIRWGKKHGNFMRQIQVHWCNYSMKSYINVRAHMELEVKTDVNVFTRNLRIQASKSVSGNLT